MPRILSWGRGNHETITSTTRAVLATLYQNQQLSYFYRIWFQQKFNQKSTYARLHQPIQPHLI